MYTKCSENQGHVVRLVERCLAKDGGIKSATIECGFKFAYGYLSGERGVHQIIENHKSEFNYPEVWISDTITKDPEISSFWLTFYCQLIDKERTLPYFHR